MTTAAERLVTLAGNSGAADALLLAIGSGATAGAALVNYSGLTSATAAVHLMTDVAVGTPPVAATPFLVDVSVGQGLDWKRKKRKKQLFLLLG